VQFKVCLNRQFPLKYHVQCNINASLTVILYQTFEGCVRTLQISHLSLNYAILIHWDTEIGL
jgi:hypothetical protein